MYIMMSKQNPRVRIDERLQRQLTRLMISPLALANVPVGRTICFARAASVGRCSDALIQ